MTTSMCMCVCICPYVLLLTVIKVTPATQGWQNGGPDTHVRDRTALEKKEKQHNRAC